MTNPMLDDQVTFAVVASVLAVIEEQPDGEIDAVAVIRGMISAVVAMAHQLHTVEEAKAILARLATQLDDPATLAWVKTNGMSAH